MTSASTNSPPEISRRTTLTHVGAAVAALGLSSRVGYAAAQETSPDTLANHPIVGVWNVSTPSGPSLAIFFADGSNIQGLPATQAGRRA